MWSQGTLGSITTNKASGGDRIAAKLFQIIKDDVVKALHIIPANLENSAVAKGLEKSVFIPTPKKVNANECSRYHTIALISHAIKVMLKNLKAMLQQYMNQELPDVQQDLEKAQEPESNC